VSSDEEDNDTELGDGTTFKIASRRKLKQEFRDSVILVEGEAEQRANVNICCSRSPLFPSRTNILENEVVRKRDKNCFPFKDIPRE